MPVTNLSLQPAVGSLHAAYRPIVFKVEATATNGTAQPPYTVCDIYIKDLYYKSMIRTAPESVGANTSIFLFDISDVLQEYLQPDLAALNNKLLLPAPHMSGKVFCRFRSSGIDAEGFTSEEGIKPVQGTKFTEPVSGDGFQSNTFFAINSALQHEDNQDLSEHLKRFRNGPWNENAYPLSHRSKYFFCNDSADHFPLIFSGPCLNTDIILHYRLKGQVYQEAAAIDVNPCNPITFSSNVVGNRVYVDLDEVVPAGQQVLVRYKLQADIAWTNVGYKTAQDFYFDVSAAGDYDLQVILFCSSCVSSNPAAGVFAIAQTNDNLAWRGYHPYCVQLQLAQDIYVSLELRNPVQDEIYYPNSETYYQKNLTEKSDLYVKFFSDAQLLTPLNLVQNGLKVFVKLYRHTIDTNFENENESVLTYVVNANGTEAFLAQVTTHQLITYYDIDNGNTPTGQQNDEYSTYTIFPDKKLIGGNNGQQGFADLEQYNTVTGIATGNTKPNADSDPDYIAPGANEAACPVGAPATTVYYGFSLQISKVELRVGDYPYSYVYAPTKADTEGGGYIYVVNVPKDQPIGISIKAKSLANGANNDGFIEVRITFDDGTQAIYRVPDNVETLLPDTFTAINYINISNT